MDLIGGLLALAVLIVVAMRLSSVIGMPLDAMRVRAKRHLFRRGDYAEGQKLVSYQFVFYSDRDSDDVREGILAQIQPMSSLPVIKSGFVVNRIDNELIMIECGNRLQLFFKGALTLTRSGVGVEGSWTIISWLRHDGMVAAREPMKQMVRHIHAGVLNVDPGARFGLIPMQRSPRIVTTYDFEDSVHVDYVQDYEAGLPAVA